MSNPTIGDAFRSIPIEWQGKQLELRTPSFDTEAKYRHHLESEARAAINRHRAGMDPTEYKTHLSAWQEACAARAFDYGSEAWAKSLGARDNFVHLLWLIVRQHDEQGNPSPNAGLSLADMDACYKAKRAEIIEAWERLQRADAPDPQQPEGPAATK